MNLLECYIVAITSPPVWRECKGVRWVEVGIRYDCYGRESECLHSFKAMEEAQALKPGDIVMR